MFQVTYCACQANWLGISAVCSYIICQTIWLYICSVFMYYLSNHLTVYLQCVHILPVKKCFSYLLCAHVIRVKPSDSSYLQWAYVLPVNTTYPKRCQFIIHYVWIHIIHIVCSILFWVTTYSACVPFVVNKIWMTGLFVFSYIDFKLIWLIVFFVEPTCDE